MLRPASLGAVRARPLGLALRAPLRRLPLRRVLLGGAATVAAVALGYVVARETSLFAVGELEVVGAPAEVRQEIREALAPLEGTSLVKVDPAGLEGQLRQLSSVLDARVDRSFPHTVRVMVEPERPLAVVTDRSVRWVVSRRGRVIRPLEPRARSPLPRVWSGSAGELAPGAMIADSQALPVLGALTGVPADFPRVRSAREDEGGLTFVLVGDRELRLGTSDDLESKLAAARAVLTALSKPERRGIGYLDVSLPQRPVAGTDSQVEGES